MGYIVQPHRRYATVVPETIWVQWRDSSGVFIIGACQESCTLVGWFVKGKGATNNKLLCYSYAPCIQQRKPWNHHKAMFFLQKGKMMTKEVTTQSVPLNNRLGTEQEKHKEIEETYYRLAFCSSRKQDWNKQYNLQKFRDNYGSLKTVKSQTV